MEKQFIIANGYTCEEDVRITDIVSGQAILTSDKIKKFKSVTHCGNSISFTKKVVVCPYCGYKSAIKNLNNKNKSFFNDWCSPQTSLFIKDKETIEFNTVKVPFEYECKHCHKVSKVATKEYIVLINSNDNIITVSIEIKDIADLINAMWADLDNVNILELLENAPLFQKIAFDFNNGESTLFIEDSKKRKVSVIDVNKEIFKLYNKCVLFSLVENNTKTRRAVKKEVEKIWGTSLPFSENELSVERIVQMSQFIGYSRSFYSNLPYYVGTMKIMDVYKPIAYELHNCDNAVKLYEKSRLPNIKSLKKFIFEQSSSGIYFFFNEIKMLLNIFENDTNILLSILNGENSDIILPRLKAFPKSMKFFKDYAKCVQKRSIAKELLQAPIEVFQYALHYIVMSKDFQLQQQCNWKVPKKENRREFFFSVTDYKPYYTEGHRYDSIDEGVVPFRIAPQVPKPLSSIKAHVEIDGYLFKALENKNDYLHASNELNNCLSEYNASYSPVYVCIRISDGKYMAAIEIDENTLAIKQALGYKNCSIKRDNKSYEAFLKYVEKYELSLLDSAIY